MNVGFDFHGYAVEVGGDALAVDEVRRDFAWFARPIERPAARLTLHARAPSYEGLPPVTASFSTPRNWCYRQGTRSYVDYFGRGLTIHDRATNGLDLYAEDGDLLHEMAYLAILSIVGQDLDRRGIHRLHALGVTRHGRAVLLLLPSGGGKSTTALELLRRPGYALLGEDTPLVDRHGDVLPFPLRLGVRAGTDPGVPARYLRTMSRMEFEPKTLIDIDAFAGRIATTAPPGLLIVGQRNLGDVSKLERLGRVAAFRALVSNLVVGLGVYQGLEFLLERGAWELAGKLGLGVSRTRASLALLARVSAWRFVMGRDVGRNIETLDAFIETQLAAPRSAASPGGERADRRHRRPDA